MDQKENEIKNVFCPAYGGTCNKKCPAWTSHALTTENINVSDYEKGWCKKFGDFDDEGKLRV